MISVKQPSVRAGPGRLRESRLFLARTRAHAEEEEV